VENSTFTLQNFNFQIPIIDLYELINASGVRGVKVKKKIIIEKRKVFIMYYYFKLI
jgi:hypothetical protein